MHFLLTSCSPCFLLSLSLLSLFLFPFSGTFSLSLHFCVFCFFPRGIECWFFPFFILPVAVGEKKSGLPFAWPPFFLALPSLSHFFVRASTICLCLRSFLVYPTPCDAPFCCCNSLPWMRADQTTGPSPVRMECCIRCACGRCQQGCAPAN